MKEYPILFSTPMVQAIFSGKKTQTRRIIKKQYDEGGGIVPKHKLWGRMGKNPYGKRGDVLWVRETWAHDGSNYLYRATDKNADLKKWKPSIFMSKDACRLKLKVGIVYFQKLQDIHEDDCLSEGAGSKQEFIQLWQSINGKDSWDLNPWVWVVEFTAISND